SEMGRTMWSPSGSASWRVRALATAATVLSPGRALPSSGLAPRGNSTSTTGPMTRMTRPTAAPVRLELSCVTAAVIWIGSLPALLVAVRARRQRVHAADDFADFLRDLGLTHRVGFALQHAGQFVGVIGGRLHCGAPSRGLGCRCL